MEAWLSARLKTVGFPTYRQLDDRLMLLNCRETVSLATSIWTETQTRARYTEHLQTAAFAGKGTGTGTLSSLVQRACGDKEVSHYTNIE